MIGMTVCSGIGAPEVSAPWIDWRYQSEIDPFPRAVLAHRFPNAVQLGDMTKFQEWPDADLDVLCGGTPCQSFSVAGLRAGLADPRGNLMLTYLAIAARYRPRWLVWENVPGVLSSNGGRDFGTFLGALGQLGYGFAYRVLDAQYVRTRRFPWAIPQRRRRVFVVGHLGDWRRAAAVLFDGDSLSGHPPPRREQGKAAPTIPARRSGGGGLGTDFDCDGGLIPSVANPLTARMAKGINTTLDEGQTPIPVVANTLRAEGGDASEDGTGRQKLVPQAHVLAIQERAVSENPDNGPQGSGVREDGAAYTLEARNKVQAVAFDTTQITSPGNYSAPKAGEGYPAIRQGWAVRRLTPLECERLMGFPDGWTAIPMHKRNRAAEEAEMLEYYRRTGQDEAIEAGLQMTFDGPRYKALGNSWAVNCGEWIFDRIEMVEGTQ